MIPIVCIDDKNGILFNNRRQSRDRLLIADVMTLCAGHRLWMDAYSAPLFTDFIGAVTVDGDFLNRAGDNDFCFVEQAPLLPHVQKIQALVLYKWNRVYPADRQLDLLPESSGFTLNGQLEFAGSSHETITRKFYIRSN